MEAKTLDRSKVEPGANVADDATTEQSFAAALIEKGLTLHDDRVKNTKETGANRTMLRGLLDQGVLSDVQATAVSALYPKPERKAKTDPAPTTPTGEPGTTPPAAPPAAPPSVAKDAPPAAPPAKK